MNSVGFGCGPLGPDYPQLRTWRGAAWKVAKGQQATPQAWPDIKAQPTEATHTRGGDPERTVADICSVGDGDRGNTDRVLRHKTPHLVCRVATGRRGITGVDRRPAAASLLAQKSERRHGRYTASLGRAPCDRERPPKDGVRESAMGQRRPSASPLRGLLHDKGRTSARHGP